MTNNLKKFHKISNELRYQIIELIHKTKTSHLGSSLSCIDILVGIYFSKNGIGNNVNNKKFKKYIYFK